jgi:hypothetical protein
MADEIMVLDGIREAPPDVPLLFIYPITTPLKDKDNANVVPTPSANLPALAAAAATQGEKDALDAGTHMFVTKNVKFIKSLTVEEMKARAKEVYAGHLAKALADYTKKYEWHVYVGTRFDAV